jgi:hypothetical protein
MQAVIAILLCFIIALGLFIAYASLGRQQEHAHPHYGGMYDVDTLYRDRLFSWWNYPSRFYYGGNDHAYHHPAHHHAGGHTHNHGTQIVFSQPTTSSPPPPAPPAPPAAPKSVQFALPQVVKEGFDEEEDDEKQEGATDMEGSNIEFPPGLRMDISSAPSPSVVSAPSDFASNLHAQAKGIMKNVNMPTTYPTPSSMPSFSMPVIPTPSTSAAAPTPDVDGFKPYSPETSCGTYNCAE